MRKHHEAQTEERLDTPADHLTPADFQRETRIEQSTQAVWRSTNRYGFRDLAIKVGRSVRYRRADIEAWLSSRKGLVTSRSPSETTGGEK
jgi:hypothetical protein